MGLLDFLFGRASTRQPGVAGGDGSAVETAIVIQGVTNNFAGVAMEHKVLADRFGKKDTDWTLDAQAVFEHGGKHYDRLNISLSSGEKKTVYVDVSAFYGKL